MIDELPFPVSDHQGEFLYCARFWNSKTVVAGGSGSNDVKIISRETKTVIFYVLGATSGSKLKGGLGLRKSKLES